MSLPSPVFDPGLRKLLRFFRQDGRIWLGGQRMLLLHAHALKAMRMELIRALGMASARRYLMRIGHAAGHDDGLLARQIRQDKGVYDAYWIGPQLHMLSGFLQVRPQHFEYSAESDHFLGIFEWHHSWEAEAHREALGLQDQPVCWMMIGYASGYSTAFFQRQVLYRERTCKACGHAHCEVEGRFLHEWPDGEALRQEYLDPGELASLDSCLRPPVASETPPVAPLDGPALIGLSPAFLQTLRLLQQVAPTAVSVLLTGETGVGKERFARALHAMSPRAAGPFVAVNCAALPAELIESELFGSEKGAYTGAQVGRPGRFERAHGGTLLLDELGEMPLAAQAKLLRVLQQGEVERLGGTDVRRVDVRVVAATNVDLEQAVVAGTFRRDLYYRLNVYPILIPPLRERIEDIEPLALHLLQHYAERHGKEVDGFTPTALHALRNHGWPGNVRELENLIERGVILTAPGGAIEAASLFPQLLAPLHDRLALCGALEGEGLQGDDPMQSPATRVFQLLQNSGLGLAALEEQLLHEAVARAHGNLAAAARSLGLTRPQLRYRLAKAREPVASQP